MENYIGELSALGAAFCFALASMTFTIAGRTFGATLSMALSLKISLVMLLLMHQAMLGETFPASVSHERWILLGSSSLAGFVVSSILLLRAFQYIGPRLAMLIGLFTPIVGALLAWVFLGQNLAANAVAGIALVVSGIAWVISQGAAVGVGFPDGQYRRGLILAFASAVGQGVSFVLMSEGVSGGFHALSASVVRSLVGAFILALVIIYRGKVGHTLRLIRTRLHAMSIVTFASLVGPVLGTTLVLLSLQFTSVGVSSTLAGATPIFLIPMSYVVFGEKITIPAVLGTVIAIAGIAMLFST